MTNDTPQPGPDAEQAESRGVPKPWPGKCGKCGYPTTEVACPRCGLWGGINYKTLPPRVYEREKLLRDATHDVRQALECMEASDWLRADILLKLAVDQLADTGLIP